MGTPHHPTPHRPLPLRDGVDPVCFRLPQHLPPEWEGRPAVDILLERFDRSRDCLAAQLAAGTIVDDDGHRITSHTPARGGLALWSYRPLPASEPTVPLTMPVLYRDDDILVIDKPHFLPTIPRGRYVTHTALVQLRRQLAAAGDTEAAALITPAHRLDRLTAGVLLFTVRKEVRGLYQTLFTRGLTHKTYFAIAPLPQPPFSSSPRFLALRLRALTLRLFAPTPHGSRTLHSPYSMANPSRYIAALWCRATVLTAMRNPVNPMPTPLWNWWIAVAHTVFTGLHHTLGKHTNYEYT